MCIVTYISLYTPTLLCTLQGSGRVKHKQRNVYSYIHFCVNIHIHTLYFAPCKKCQIHLFGICLFFVRKVLMVAKTGLKLRMCPIQVLNSKFLFLSSQCWNCRLHHQSQPFLGLLKVHVENFCYFCLPTCPFFFIWLLEAQFSSGK